MPDEWRRPMSSDWKECVDRSCHSVQAGIPHYADPVHMETLAEIKAWRELEYPGHSHLPSYSDYARRSNAYLDGMVRAKARGDRRVRVAVYLGCAAVIVGSWWVLWYALTKAFEK